MYSSSLILLFFLTLKLVEPKVASCKNKFDSDDWIYCTKFGTSSKQNLNIELRAKHTATFKNAEGSNYVEVGIYKDYNWDDLVNNYQMKCSEKRDKAVHLTRLEVPY